MTELMEQELTPKTPETSFERQETFVDKDPTKTYLVLCSDDRGLTKESAAEIRSQYPQLESPFEAIRFYGGAIGASRAFATVIALQYGEDFLKRNFSNDFIQFTKSITDSFQSKNKIILGVHTAEKNEHNPAHLNVSSRDGIGCAFAGGVNLVTALNQTDSTIELSKSENSQLLTNAIDPEKIAEGNAIVSSIFFHSGTKADRGMDRKDYINLGVPVGVLEGSHLKADDTVVVFNFKHDKISQPTKAVEKGVGFYNVDITQAAEMFLRTFPELDLDIDVILSVLAQEAIATREALASSEGKHAADLKIERYGNAGKARAYLQGLKNKLVA